LFQFGVRNSQCLRGVSVTFSETRYEHIVVDDNGAPRIAGTTMKVVELVTAQIAYGWSPEELHFQFPHLSLGQIHSALAYYWDHQDEVDQDIARRLATVNQQQTGSSALRARLRARAGR
jgi:uncharacterized protein (DUF433 family)